MSKFTKKVTKKVRIKLSPKEAEDIIRQEIIDNYGNKIIKLWEKTKN